MKAPALPALMPLPVGLHPQTTEEQRVFWGVLALNYDTQLVALDAQLERCQQMRGMDGHVTRQALVVAIFQMGEARDRAFMHARNVGGLLLAWRGSRALVEALPNSLKGGAA